MPLESLGLPPVVGTLAERGKGLILITGSTSQGKTTTMASLIDAINRRSRKHIITIEDPIEVVHSNKQSLVRQREVGRDTKTFGSGLRAALRQDPDVLMIGEMRDAETIETALRAAEAGVLVISTLHIVSIEKMIDRLLTYMPPGREHDDPVHDRRGAPGSHPPGAAARRSTGKAGRVRGARRDPRRPQQSPHRQRRPVALDAHVGARGRACRR